MKYSTILITTALVFTSCSRTNIQNNDKGSIVPLEVVSNEACKAECTGDSICLNDCALRMSIQTQKPGWCTHISDSNLQNSCFVELAVAIDSPNICLYSSQKDICLLTIAEATYNKTICIDIQSKLIQQKCFELQKTNILE